MGCTHSTLGPWAGVVLIPRRALWDQVARGTSPYFVGCHLSLKGQLMDKLWVFRLGHLPDTF